MHKAKHVFFVRFILIISVIIFAVVLSLVIFQGIFNLYFQISSYDYVEYNGRKYIPNENLIFENEVVFNQNGEYSYCKNGEEVIVKINGWYPQKMILLSNEQNNYLFDYYHWDFLENEEIADFDLFEKNSIEEIVIYSYKSDTEYIFTAEEIDLFLKQAEKLRINNNLVPDDFITPHEDDWGIIKIKECGSPDNAYYEMFSYSVKDERTFLMSNSDSFGFEFGQYIYIESSNK